MASSGIARSLEGQGQQGRAYGHGRDGSHSQVSESLLRPARPERVETTPLVMEYTHLSHASSSPPQPSSLLGATTLAAAALPSLPSPMLGLGMHAGGTSPYAFSAFHSPPASSMLLADAAGPSPGPGANLHVSLPPASSMDSSLDLGLASTRSSGGATNMLLDDDDGEDFMREERACCPTCCASCRSCACARCLSHCWFLTACCGFVLLSSLPRFLTLLDFIGTALIYSLSFAGRSQPSLSFWQFLQEDFTHYSWQRSGGSLVILSFVRMCILFWTFAYRFHLKPAAFVVSTVVAGVSVLFVLVKWSFNLNSHLQPLLIFSLSMAVVEYLTWLALRRQRIKQPRLQLEQMHVDAIIGSSGAYQQPGIGLDEEHSQEGVDGHDDPRGLEAGLMRGDAQRGSDADLVPRTPAADVKPITKSKAGAAYQRLEGSEDAGRTFGSVADRPASSVPRRMLGRSSASASFSSSPSFSSLSQAGSLGSTPGSLIFPRLAVAPPERELEPQALADPDSLFIQIDSLLVHFKLCIQGQPIVGQEPEKQARMALAAALDAREAGADAGMAAAHAAIGAATIPSRDLSEEVPRRVSDAAASSAAASPLFPPTVLLHGFGSSLFQWRAVWAELSAQCSVLLAFDRPGFGLTSRPLKDASGSYGTYIVRDGEGGSALLGGKGQLREQPNPYTAEYSVSLMLSLLSKLGLDGHPAVLVGHSTGATVALRTALVAPSRCLGLFLISPHVLTTGFPDLVKSLLKTKLGALITQQLVRSELGEVALKRAWYDARRIPSDTLANYIRTLSVKHYIQALMEMAACASTGADTKSDPLANLALHLHKLAPADAQAQLQQQAATSQLDGSAAAAAASSSSAGALPSLVTYGTPLVSPAVSSARGVPVWLLHGLQDKLVDVTESVRVYKSLKGSGAAVTLVKIDHCGHVPHEEYPALFMQHLQAFVKEVQGGGRATGSTYSRDDEQEHEHEHGTAEHSGVSAERHDDEEDMHDL